MELFTGEIASIILFFIGFYGLITQKSIIKSIIAIGIIETATVVFFLSVGYVSGGAPPIGQNLQSASVVDPLPQALVITAIIIGVAVTAVNLTMLISLFRQYKTADWDQAKNNGLE